MATLAERMDALRAQGISHATPGQIGEMEARAAARHAARAAVIGRGGHPAQLTTREADQLAEDALASVSSGTAHQPEILDGETGEPVEQDSPKRAHLWVKGQSGNPKGSALIPQDDTQFHNVECATDASSLGLVQNQMVKLDKAMRFADYSIDYLGRMVTGRAKVSAALRFQASCKILDMCGISADAVDRLEKLRATPGGGVDLANLAGQLARAAELANRRKTAETVQIQGQNTGNTGTE